LKIALIPLDENPLGKLQIGGSAEGDGRMMHMAALENKDEGRKKGQAC